MIAVEAISRWVSAAHPGAHAIFASVYGDNNGRGQGVAASVICVRVVVGSEKRAVAVVQPKHGVDSSRAPRSSGVVA